MNPHHPGQITSNILRTRPWVKNIRAEVRKVLGVSRLTSIQATEVDRVAAVVVARLVAPPVDPLVERAREIRDARLAGMGGLPDSIRDRMLRSAARRVGPDVRAAYDRCNYRRAMHSHRTQIRCAVGRWSASASTSVGSASPTSVGLARSYARKAYSVATSEHTLTVRPTWVREVQSRGLAVIDGMLTLDARPIAGLPDHYEAAWVRQGRGTSLVTERGVVARIGVGAWVHARSVEHARKLAHARLAQARWVANALAAERDREARASARLAGLDGWTPEEQAVVVHVTDSTGAGNCPSGTHDWIERHFTGRASATVGEIMAVAFTSGDRIVFAAQACLHAIRATRKAA